MVRSFQFRDLARRTLSSVRSVRGGLNDANSKQTFLLDKTFHFYEIRFSEVFVPHCCSGSFCVTGNAEERLTLGANVLNLFESCLATLR